MRVCVSQVEVDTLRSENDSLKAAESQVVMTMKQNAQVASEYLNKTASHAHSSIRSVPPVRPLRETDRQTDRQTERQTG